MNEIVFNRRLAAIMVADVVGFSRLMEQDEVGLLESLKLRWANILNPVVESYGGRVVKLMGDGVLVENSSAINVVKSAIELQRRMADANQDTPQGSQIWLRIGINLGDVIGEGTDIYGEGVNIAARLEPLAKAGGICLSEKVHNEVKGKVDAVAVDMGPLQLKNISASVRGFAIYAAGADPEPTQASKIHAERDFTTIAVLPLDSMSSNRNDDYFADGITEDIITELARCKHLSVVARNTTFTYKGRSINVVEIGRELGADFVLEGSVRMAGKRVRVTIQLIDSKTGAHVFAEKFDREMEDIFAVQDEIVDAITSRLFFNIQDAAVLAREKIPTKSVSAYTLWLRGSAAYRSGQDDVALDHWLEAIRIDPKYARALASLASLVACLMFHKPAVETNPVRERDALEYAKRAFAADKSDTYVLNSVAMCHMLLGNTSDGLRYSDMAYSLSPRDSETLFARGSALTYAGRHSEGLAFIERAVMFEPHLPPAYHFCLSDCYYVMQQFEASLSASMTPPEPAIYFNMNQAAALAQLGRIEEAKQKIAELPSDFDTTIFALNSLRVFAAEQDKVLWLDGWRRAGVAV